METSSACEILSGDHSTLIPNRKKPEALAKVSCVLAFASASGLNGLLIGQDCHHTPSLGALRTWPPIYGGFVPRTA